MSSLKDRLQEHYNEVAADYDLGESQNALELLETVDLERLNKWDHVLLSRIIQDEDLQNELDELREKYQAAQDDDIFS